MYNFNTPIWLLLITKCNGIVLTDNVNVTIHNKHT